MDAADVVAGAVASYALWAERDEAMRALDGSASQPEFEAFGDDLHGLACGECVGGVGVAEVVKPDLRKPEVGGK